MSGYGARSPRWSARMESTSAPPAATCAASAAKYRSRSPGSTPAVTASSAWSTTRVCRPSALNPLSDSVGRAPGVVTRTRVPPREQRSDDAGADQRRLADAGRTDDRQDAGVTEPPEARRDVGLPAEERVGVLGVVGQQSAVRAADADVLAHDRIQGRVLAK